MKSNARLEIPTIELSGRLNGNAGSMEAFLEGPQLPRGQRPARPKRHN
jgi:hypothetical protein